MRNFLNGLLFIGLYLILTIAPLIFAFIGSTPAGKTFWTEFSVALGFVGLAMMTLQFAITSRFQGVAAPFGIDVVIQFHRQISILAFVLIVTHPAILMIEDLERLQLLNPFQAPWRATAGLAAILLLALLIVSSIWRKQLRLRYEIWRIAHALFATAAVILALMHVVGVGRYVSMPWKQALWISFSALFLGLLIYVRLVKPIRLLNRPYEVVEVKPERGNSYTLVLRPVGHPAMEFQPGQFAWLTVYDSPFAIEEHPFSFSSSARDRSTVAMTIKALGDFTSTIRDIPPGTRAYLEGPHGVFTPDRAEGPGFFLIAGGIGITPIMCILRTFADREDKRPLTLVYASKSWDDTTFREELEQLKARLDLKLVYVLTEAPQNWSGETGYVNADLLGRYLPDECARYQYFICGPPPMMDAVEKALRSHGISLDNIHTERFNLA